MKSKGFFVLLLFFAVISFTWWTVQVYRSDRENLRAQNDLLAMEIQLAKQELRTIWLSERLEGVNDTSWLDSARRLMLEHYPRLVMQIGQSGPEVHPTEITLALIQDEFAAKKKRRLVEGSLFFFVLLSAFIWIYRSLVAAIELNRQQNNFLLAVTHELKTPVAGIKLLLQTLRRDLSRDQKDTVVEQGITESDRLADLVENILVASRLQEGEVEQQHEQVNLSEVAEQLVANMSKSFARFNWRLFIPENAFVKGDELAIKLVLTNLLDNARKYSPEGSEIVLRIEPSNKKSKWMVSVSDQGKGIADKDKKKIFDKFYRVEEEIRRKSKGTGLGLFIVKEVLKMHGASVSVQNNEPKGTKFLILIPQI
ncbi:MAG: HAMP domain-containing histidine kinase [Bacteroidetes bacterium]|nr:MAG: HAMP domain-containing histidine kinase [Bacteroidota bacterium]